MTEVRVVPDGATLARTVAEQLVARLAAIQAEGRAPSLVLTGGTIAGEIYRVMADLDTDAVDWMQVDFWWGDERYVPADSTDRNDRGAELDLLDVVGADPARVHAMPAADEVHPDVANAAASYAELVRTHGSGEFDLVLLGVGPDGHVASLFPGFPQLDVEDDITAPVTDSPKPPPERVSLTYRALNNTRATWFLVSGDGKADAAAQAIGGADLHAIPAAGARGQDETVWFLDEPAASRLPSGPSATS